jgi:hypothetical protein
MEKDNSPPKIKIKRLLWKKEAPIKKQFHKVEFSSAYFILSAAPIASRTKRAEREKRALGVSTTIDIEVHMKY